MEPDERQDAKLADVQTEPETTTELTTELTLEPTTELTPETSTDVKAAKMKKKKTKNPKRVEQGKKLAEWNKANKRRQLEPALKQATSSTPEPALKQLEATSSTPKSSFETKGDTKDYFLIGETILIIGLLSVGLFCYTTSLTFNKSATSSKAQLEDATSGKAQPESTQPEAEAEAGVKHSKKAQLVETQSKEDNIFDMYFFLLKKTIYIV